MVLLLGESSTWAASWFVSASPVARVLLLVAAVLAAGSLLRLFLLRGRTPEAARRPLLSLLSWWVLLAVLAVAVLGGRAAGVAVLAAISLLGWREYLALLPPSRAARRVRPWTYLLLGLHYLWIYLGWDEAVWAFLPVFGLLLLAARMVLTDETAGFIGEIAALYWGLMLVGYAFSHTARLLVLPDATNPAAGAPGWLLYVVLVTDTSDIAQALWGRSFGRRPLAPRLSPKKTWEGLLGGVATALVLALLLAPAHTPLADSPPRASRLGVTLPPWSPALAAGLLIALAGVLGDLTVSGIKRDVGAKDSGTLVPGQGGMLDRIDSLIFTAPLFYYFVQALVAVR